MPIRHVKAPAAIMERMAAVQAKNHPHLDDALICIEFVDSKPYLKDRLNLGKVAKFSAALKLWLHNSYDFRLSICSDVWYDLLDDDQREAYLDLLLTRCQIEYEPNTVVVNGKRQVVKDEWGRIEYTDEPKYDDEGHPVWKVSPLDIAVISQNIKRYGLWFDDLVELKQAIESHEKE